MNSTKSISKNIPLSVTSRNTLYTNVGLLSKFDIQEAKDTLLQRLKDAIRKEYKEILDLTKDSSGILATYPHICIGSSSTEVDFVIPKNQTKERYVYYLDRKFSIISDQHIRSDLGLLSDKIRKEEEVLSNIKSLISNCECWDKLPEDVIELGIKLGLYAEDEDANKINPKTVYTSEALAVIINGEITF